jgi:DNA-binding CsgD family transcriptional regulator
MHECRTASIEVDGNPRMHRDIELHSNLVQEIYSASVHPERWDQVVASIAASFGFGKGLLFTPFVAPQDGGIIVGAGIDKSCLKSWAGSYAEADVWAQALGRHGPIHDGLAYTEENLVPQQEFPKLPFHRDFLGAMGMTHTCGGVVMGGAPDNLLTALAIFRGLNDRAFDRDDVRWMQTLIPHVGRSVEMMQRLDSARLQNAALLASYDKLSFGVALLDRNMRVLQLNKAAQEVIERKDGIYLDDQRRLESLPATARLQNAPGGQSTERRKTSGLSLAGWLAAVRDRTLSASQHHQDGYVLGRTNAFDPGGRTTRRHYLFQCVPLAVSGGGSVASRHGAGGQEVHFALIITDPQSVQLPSVERLCSLYDLTPAQAKVVCAFAGGGTYKDVAGRLAVGEETIRAHLKEIYPKTRVNRLADLVRLTLSLSQSGV